MTDVIQLRVARAIDLVHADDSDVGTRSILNVMATPDRSLVSGPDDPRLVDMDLDDVSGADQVVARLAATPDERLDSLTALVAFIDEGREALSKATG